MYRRYWLVILLMALATPLGLLAGGTAWGEWGPEEMANLVGFMPRGIEQAANWWQALLPDYTVKGLGEGAGYIFSAFVGAGAVYALTLVYLRLIARPK